MESNAVTTTKSSPFSTNEALHATGTPLDAVLGGGLSRGRVVEIFGPSNAGKTALALRAAHSFGSVAVIDCGGRDASAKQPTGWRQALRMAIASARNHEVVVVDDLGTLLSERARDAGANARALSSLMRELTAVAHRSGAAVIFVTRLDSIGAVFGHVTNNHAIKFYASARVSLTRAVARAVKCKWAVPFREVAIDG